MKIILIRVQNCDVASPVMPKYKNSPYRTAMGISRSNGVITSERNINTFTSSGAILFSRTHSTFVFVCPPTVISSTSDSARMNCGECGSDPVIGGRPKNENASVVFRLVREQRGYVHLHVHQEREKERGDDRERGDPTRPAVKVHDPVPTVRGFDVVAYVEHLHPVHVAAPGDEGTYRDRRRDAKVRGELAHELQQERRRPHRERPETQVQRQDAEDERKKSLRQIVLVVPKVPNERAQARADEDRGHEQPEDLLREPRAVTKHQHARVRERDDHHEQRRPYPRPRVRRREGRVVAVAHRVELDEKHGRRAGRSQHDLGLPGDEGEEYTRDRLREDVLRGAHLSVRLDARERPERDARG
eukprot:31270-Pelagococcus_subviridis.AAC.27